MISLLSGFLVGVFVIVEVSSVGLARCLACCGRGGFADDEPLDETGWDVDDWPGVGDFVGLAVDDGRGGPQYNHHQPGCQYLCPGIWWNS